MSAGLEGLTAKEAAERKAELSKIRALQTYQEARFRRQGKIKSKKYRKIARKEREKEKLQELEHLQNTDPEAAREKLEEMEKMRIDERASLKHRNASKYLQLQVNYGAFVDDILLSLSSGEEG
jgi:U3 small nucleolar RNA-associated protein 14